jgi:predicted nucleotidyltransferase component of viral defense system
MKWLDLSPEERDAALNTVSQQLDIDTPSVEKDWWVTAVLRALFQTSFAPYLLFKGGTSLSKGWRLINRFSEDIDISLGREWFEKQGYAFAAGANKSQRERLRKQSREVVHTLLADELREQLKALGISSFEIVPVTTQTRDGVIVPIDSDKDPAVLHIKYNTTIEGFQPDYILPIVKVEVSCLSLKEPFEPRPIVSLLHETFDDLDEETRCIINTVSPERTFLEKAFLLNEEFQKSKPRTRRMSRHYYDLEKLMDTDFGIKALANQELYNHIIEHRQQFYNLHYVDYKKNLSNNICFYPPEKLLEAFRADYANMIQTFIFKAAPAFDDLMTRIAELQERFHNIK